ncbi:MAG: DUF533 domain-containing protein [Candidatus Binatia bacterium]
MTDTATTLIPTAQEADAAIAALCVMAAFADGQKNDAEREQVRAAAGGLDGETLAAVYQDVLRQRTTLEREAARLTAAADRQLAYEMAVCVCDADGVATADERAFLERLRAALGLDAGAAASLRDDADALVAAAEPEPAAPTPAPAGEPTAAAGERQGMVLNYAMLTAGLELLPQSMASLAIIPLQTKMVYRIGAQHGVTLDRTQVTELLGAVGIGLTGQLIENFARKLLGGFARKAGGKLFGRTAGTAVGAAATFATTWALGQVAEAYYAGGRRLDPAALKQLFTAKSGEAQALYAQYRGEIETRARTIDVQQLLPLIRGQ